MSKSTRSFLMINLWFALFVFVIRCVISGNALINAFSIYDLFSYAGEAILIASAFAFFYERWLWRYNPFSTVPIIYGEYQGKIFSTKSSEDYKEARFQIKQTLLSVIVKVSTSESSSGSITASIVEVQGKKALIYSYLNTPQQKVRKSSPIHYGTTILYLDNPQKLEGTYYTDRDSAGDLILTPVCPVAKRK